MYESRICTEDELEPVNCDECGQGNVAAGAELGCTDCSRWLAAIERHARVDRHNESLEALLIGMLAEPMPSEEYDDTEGAYANPELVMGAGVVTPPGQVRVWRAYAGMRAGYGSWADVTLYDNHKPVETLAPLATYGWATSPFSDDDTATLAHAAEQGYTGCTVTVRDADGNISIKSVNEYRRKRAEKQAARKAAEPTETREQTDARLMAGMGTIHSEQA